MTTVYLSELDREVSIEEASHSQKYKLINSMPSKIIERCKDNNYNHEDIKWMKRVVSKLTDMTAVEISCISMSQFSDLFTKVVNETFREVDLDQKNVTATMTVNMYDDGEVRIKNYSKLD